MITSCNCVSGGSGVCILCLFMPFAKVSLGEGLGSLVWVAERWGNVRTNIVHEQRAGRSDSKAAFGFRDKICSNFSFGFQVVRVLRRSDSGVTSVVVLCVMGLLYFLIALKISDSCMFTR